MTVAGNVAAVHERIAAACERAGRSPSEVTLVAVSKTFGADALLEAIAAGVTDLGENRVQELKEKAVMLGERVRWHFVGPLQSNKVRHLLGLSALIHSVDRLGLAAEIARRAEARGHVQDVLIEVNVSGEASKQGVEPAGALQLAREAAALPGLRVSGLMTMTPFSEDPESSRPYFADLAELRDLVRTEVPSASELSMGMTRDFEVAVEEGATLVRVGEAIFGPRRPR